MVHTGCYSLQERIGLGCRIKAILRIWEWAYGGWNALLCGLYKGFLSVFKQVFRRKPWKSRKARSGFEPDTSRLPYLRGKLLVHWWVFGSGENTKKSYYYAINYYAPVVKKTLKQNEKLQNLYFYRKQQWQTVIVKTL